MLQQMTLVVCELITTCLSVAKCQYYYRYRKITVTVANLFTYLLRRITKTTELTKKLFLNSILTRCYSGLCAKCSLRLIINE